MNDAIVYVVHPSSIIRVITAICQCLPKGAPFTHVWERFEAWTCAPLCTILAQGVDQYPISVNTKLLLSSADELTD